MTRILLIITLYLFVSLSLPAVCPIPLSSPPPLPLSSFLRPWRIPLSSQPRPSTSSTNKLINTSTNKQLNSSTLPQRYEHYERYKLIVVLDPLRKRLTVNQEITWINNSDVVANEIHLHLYPNAYSSSRTLYMQGREVPENSVTRIRFKTLTLSKPLSSFLRPWRIPLSSFLRPWRIPLSSLPLPPPPDSTLLILPFGGVPPGDSIIIITSYTLRIPEAFGRFGHTADQNLYWISQWYPKPGVFQNGIWECAPFFPNTEFFSDFANYHLTLTIPSDYTPVVPGLLLSKEKSPDGTTTYRYTADRIHDLAFGVIKEYIPAQTKFKKKDGSDITVSAYLLPYNLVLKERVLTAAKNTLAFLEREIGPYPYPDLALVDVPKNSGSIASMEYPRVITYSTDYFIPPRSLQLEKVITHELVHQYFYGIVANNEVREAWLDEAFANYLTTKILEEYYPPEMSYFKLFGYYPVPGFVLLEQSEIPLIYTLSSFRIPPLSQSLINYFRNPEAGSIAMDASSIESWTHYAAIHYSKGELLLHSLEMQIGKKEFLSLLSGYFREWSWRHPTGEDFWNHIRKGTAKDVEFLYANFYKGSGKGDYRISEIEQVGGEVRVRIERSGEVVFPSEVVLYTSGGSIIQNWSGEERIKIIKFKTSEVVYGAEVDPGRKNIFDTNYANNSKMLELQIMGSLSISLKWFFWMQNLLMIFGGLA
ncbi:MAG: M1 family metallopeptidase [Ignavibacteriaceae bacterium]